MHTNDASIRTGRQVKEAFIHSGRSICKWADQNGFNRWLVYAVIDGKARGIRGQSHLIAVALGMKIEPKDKPE